MADQLLSLWVRHGETAANASGLFRGSTNPPLNEKGMQQAGIVRDRLKNMDLGEAYSSDRLRTQQTAGIVLQPHDSEPILDKNLRAINVGYLAGQPKANHQDEMQFYQDHPDVKIPEGESINQFKTRVRPRIRHVTQRGFETGLPSIAFVHSSIIHEIGAMFHGNHGAVLVHPGGVVGVFHNSERGLYAKPLYGAKKTTEHYGS